MSFVGDAMLTFNCIIALSYFTLNKLALFEPHDIHSNTIVAYV